MKKFFNIKSSRTWVNVMQVEAIYQVSNTWTVRMTSGGEYPLTDDEYWDLMDAVRDGGHPMMPNNRQENEQR